MPTITEDTVEAILDELDLEALTPQPQPKRPLQNALVDGRAAVSVIVTATACSRELLRALESINEAKQELVQRSGKKAEIIVAVYGAEQTRPALMSSPHSGKTIRAGLVTQPTSFSLFAPAEEFDARIVSRGSPNCAAAINAAAGIARGKILVFLKPDLIPRRNCLCHIAEAIADRKSLGGGTDVASESASVRSRLASMLIRLPLRLSGISLGVTFVRKGVFRKLGGFKETLFSGETVEFALRLRKHAAMTGGRFANVRAICATRYGRTALSLSLKEWLMLLILPLV